MAVNVPAEAAAAFGAFVKYDKMGEDSGSVGACAGREFSNAYVVTEKVHGANFCLIAASIESAAAVEVRFAKRTAVLGRAADAEDFYCCRSSGLLRRLAPCAEAVFRCLAARSPDVEAVHVYGELFGGRYPHPEVPADAGLQPVQVGVWYAPDLQFMAFDVVLEVCGARSFLDFGGAAELCEACGLLFAAPLHRGTLAECLEYPVEFETTLPARLGLPPLPPGNLAEGAVIRPMAEPPARAGAAVRAGKESTRGLFKRKIAAFSEKQYQNDEWRKGKAGGGGRAPEVGDEDLARMEITALVTEQRLANVLSKTGRVDPGDKAACRQLLHDLKEDVREALEDGDAEVLGQSPVLQGELDGLCRVLITQDLVGDQKRHQLQPGA